METRSLLPSGAFLLSLLLAGLLLLNSDLSPESGCPVGAEDGGWVRVAIGEEEGSFHRVFRGERLSGLLQREMPGWEMPLSEDCSEQPLVAGTVIHLAAGENSRQGSCSVSPLPERHRYLMGMPMDVNRAEKEDLVLLPGIGEALAGRIVETRGERQGFSAADDLVWVRGIGRKLMEKVRGQITVGP